MNLAAPNAPEKARPQRVILSEKDSNFRLDGYGGWTPWGDRRCVAVCSFIPAFHNLVSYLCCSRHDNAGFLPVSLAVGIQEQRSARPPVLTLARESLIAGALVGACGRAKVGLSGVAAQLPGKIIPLDTPRRPKSYCCHIDPFPAKFPKILEYVSSFYG